MKDFAEQLSDCLLRKSDIDAEIKALTDAAKEQGINVRALRKVARDMVTDPTKLAKRLEDERQTDLFRDAVDLLARKGLHGERIDRAKTATEGTVAYLQGARAIREAAE